LFYNCISCVCNCDDQSADSLFVLREGLCVSGDIWFAWRMFWTKIFANSTRISFPKVSIHWFIFHSHCAIKTSAGDLHFILCATRFMRYFGWKLSLRGRSARIYSPGVKSAGYYSKVRSFRWNQEDRVNKIFLISLRVFDELRTEHLQILT